MNPKKLNIEAGMKFGKLEVVREVERFTQPSGQWQRAFLCRCDCGQEKRVRLSHLRTGRVVSCGCEAGEHHGMCRTPLYTTLRGMKNRCHNPNYPEWHLYGGRGIQICKEWRESFIAFRDWALSNGFIEGLEIDRIDNDKGYEPGNCRFVTSKDNHRNRRVTLRVNYHGETLPLLTLLERQGKTEKYATIANRLYLGWTHVDAIDTPIRQGNYRGKAA